jgi:hypothetical protein
MAMRVLGGSNDIGDGIKHENLLLDESAQPFGLTRRICVAAETSMMRNDMVDPQQDGGADESPHTDNTTHSPLSRGDQRFLSWFNLQAPLGLLNIERKVVIFTCDSSKC